MATSLSQVNHLWEQVKNGVTRGKNPRALSHPEIRERCKQILDYCRQPECAYANVTAKMSMMEKVRNTLATLNIKEDKERNEQILENAAGITDNIEQFERLLAELKDTNNNITSVSVDQRKAVEEREEAEGSASQKTEEQLYDLSASFREKKKSNMKQILNKRVIRPYFGVTIPEQPRVLS